VLPFGLGTGVGFGGFDFGGGGSSVSGLTQLVRVFLLLLVV
jgi:hypothetical protein